jgi:STE24 endopeptidase
VTPPSSHAILAAFLVLSLAREGAETLLAAVNRRYYRDPHHQEDAMRRLGVAAEDMHRSLAYAEDRFRFALVSDWVRLVVSLGFIAVGGIGAVEHVGVAAAAHAGGRVLVAGLAFFALLAAAGALLGLPFDYYSTFVIEEKHGFNRQTHRGFIVDRLKGWALGVALGGPLLAALLWLLGSGSALWWLYAWGAVTAFSVFAMFIYPRWLAPLFNRFTPLPDGELASRIRELAQRIGFRTGGIFVMDASRRTAHGNAYFTGLFREKRIVLFDTLLQALSTPQVVAVLAHELGHFKLHHVRIQLLRGVAMTGATLYLMHLCLGLVPFYQAFGLGGASPHGALLVFSAWFGLLDFVLQPLGNLLSRRHEFAADAFAVKHEGTGARLAEALLRLREQSRALPLCHPIFSWVYHSHPPLLERLRALSYSGGGGAAGEEV